MSLIKENTLQSCLSENSSRCSEFTWEHSCKRAILTEFCCKFVNVSLSCECSTVDLLYGFTDRFYQKHLDGRLLLLLAVRFSDVFRPKTLY